MLCHNLEPDIDGNIRGGCGLVLAASLINIAALIALTMTFGWRGAVCWVASQAALFLCVCLICRHMSRAEDVSPYPTGRKAS